MKLLNKNKLKNYKIGPFDIKSIMEERYPFYMPDGKLIGFLNQAECMELRCQIKASGYRGVYVMKNGQKHEYNHMGHFVGSFVDIFTASNNLYSKLYQTPSPHASQQITLDDNWSYHNYTYTAPKKEKPKIFYEQEDGTEIEKSTITIQ